MTNGRFLGVSYFEIPVADLERAITFYETLFDVQLVRDTVDGYAMALFPDTEGAAGATGALAKGDVHVPAKAGPIVYIAVPDIDAVLGALVDAKGTVLLEPRVVADQGVVAEFEDSEGNRVALFQSVN
ncbi:MAG: VOC family protein [Pseudomonadota bacterium]